MFKAPEENPPILSKKRIITFQPAQRKKRANLALYLTRQFGVRGKPSTPLRATVRGQNTAKSPGLSERPLRDAQAWRAGRYDQEWF